MMDMDVDMVWNFDDGVLDQAVEDIESGSALELPSYFTDACIIDFLLTQHLNHQDTEMMDVELLNSA